MTSIDDITTPAGERASGGPVRDRGARRRKDSQASRAALLDAAGKLFDERGYNGATIRDIGERAGVDPALIARYFGGKEGLSLAALAGEAAPREALDPDDAVAGLLGKTEQRRHSPLTLAVVSPDLTSALRDQVRPLISRRLIQPLTDWLEQQGTADPRLRAELLVAAAIGISLARDSGVLEHLAATPLADVQELLEPLLSDLRGPGQG